MNPGQYHQAPLGPSGGQQGSFWQNLRLARGAIKAYLLLLLVTMGLFSVVVLTLTRSADTELVLILFGLWCSTFLGVALGQTMALLRIRSWVLVLGTVIWGFGSGFLGVALAELGRYGVAFASFLGMVPFFLWGGLFSLRARRALAAAWLPLMYGVVAAIIIIEKQGKLSVWLAGDKHAIWDLTTLAVLAVTVTLLVIYLVWRERLRLDRWRQGPRALLPGSTPESAAAARPRLALGGWILLVAMALALTAGLALTAPYMWRTGPAPRGDDDGGTEYREAKKKPSPQTKKGWDQLVEALEKAVKATVEMVRRYWSLLLLLLLFLLLLLAAQRPARRALYVRHLRRPFYSLPPTARIENNWRMVELALGDQGLHREHKETASSLCGRACKELRPDAELRDYLQRAAAVRDRVTYGLGVGGSDVEEMKVLAELSYDKVRMLLPHAERWRSLFRKI